MTQENTVIVIFGGTGDLARRKLVPALFQLGCKERLPKGLRIVGFARPEYSDEQYRELMWNSVREFDDLAVRRDQWTGFAQNLYYINGNLTLPEDYDRLKRRLWEFEEDWRTLNFLFYLSIAPQLFDATIENLGASSLADVTDGRRPSHRSCPPRSAFAPV